MLEFVADTAGLVLAKCCCGVFLTGALDAFGGSGGSRDGGRDGGGGGAGGRDTTGREGGGGGGGFGFEAEGVGFLSGGGGGGRRGGALVGLLKTE